MDEIRQHIDLRIAEGFDTPEGIAESTRDYFELPEGSQDLMPLVQESLAKHLMAQRAWPEKTDCDRLDDCFVELEKDGIVARQNFTCCQTCGHAEIGDEIEAARMKGAVAGYTFYHQQDTESAAAGGGVYLAYGSLSGEEPKTLEVAARIVETLKRSSLKVVWDGTVSNRIHVSLDWKRRRSDAFPKVAAGSRPPVPAAVAAAPDEVFRKFEREAKATFDNPNIGWRTAYAAICVLAMLPVSLILTRAIAKSLDGLWVGLPIAIVFSGMVVFWARRGDADARLRRDVLPGLTKTLLSLGMTEPEIEEGWHRMLRRNPRLGRRVSLQDILALMRRAQAP